MVITVTDSAATKVKELLDQEGDESLALRVAVRPGGCSGFSYVFRWETEPRANDEVFEAGGDMKIFVDPKSYKYLRGTVLDCDTSMLGQSLIFRNPNAKSECGCGLSFDV